MKLIIDITENEYRHIKEYYEKNDIAEATYSYIYHGIPLKQGHWIEKDGFDGDVYYDCSECGESWTTIEGTPWQNGMAYCPNCGAKMFEPQKSEDKHIKEYTDES